MDIIRNIYSKTLRKTKKDLIPNLKISLLGERGRVLGYFFKDQHVELKKTEKSHRLAISAYKGSIFFYP